MKIPPGGRTYTKVTAYHEAGHALALLHEGRQVRRIYVSMDGHGGGFCRSAAKKKNPYNILRNQRSAKAAWINTLESTYADIRIALAKTEQVKDDANSFGQAFGPEEHPADHNGQHRIRMAQRSRHTREPNAETETFYDQEPTVEQTPHQEVPTRSMPESAEDKHDEQIPVGLRAGAAAAAQRNVEVVSEP